METVKLLLTAKQTELLSEVFSKRSGDGMIIGQFFDATEGEGFFVVGVVDEERAQKLQAIMGVPVGTMSPEEHEVFCDVE